MAGEIVFTSYDVSTVLTAFANYFRVQVIDEKSEQRVEVPVNFGEGWDLTPSKNQSVLRKKDMELIIEARNRLLANLIEPPTIRELAQLTGTNENKLKKGFKLLYNTSINKLLQNERLSKAKLLIAEESYPIKEIAKMVGYKHSGHFTSKFKKKFGVLPKEYIKTMGH